jgi:hypothetical protein
LELLIISIQEELLIISIQEELLIISIQEELLIISIQEELLIAMTVKAAPWPDSYYRSDSYLEDSSMRVKCILYEMGEMEQQNGDTVCQWTAWPQNCVPS